MISWSLDTRARGSEQAHALFLRASRRRIDTVVPLEQSISTLSISECIRKRPLPCVCQGLGQLCEVPAARPLPWSPLSHLRDARSLDVSGPSA